MDKAQDSRINLVAPFKRNLITLAVAQAVLGSFASESYAAVIVLGGSCTLVEAIKSANTDSSAVCTPGDGVDTITLVDDVTLYNEYSISNGTPTITSNITINGADFTIERDSMSSDAFRLFDVSNTTLTLNSLTLQGGSLSIRSGGAIYAHNSSKLYLDNVTINNNTASGYGGGISFRYSTSMSISNSTISNNSANGVGGGISIVGGAVTITDTLLTSNNAGRGGSIYVFGVSPLILDSVTISNSTAAGAGGLDAQSSSLSISNSSFISNNATANDGGGISLVQSNYFSVNNTIFSNNQAFRYGAGLNIQGTGSATILNSSFSSNTAGFRGGGLQSHSSILVTGSTFSTNKALDGGGIAIQGNSVAELSNNTLSMNSATGNGGGIHTEEMSEINLFNTTLYFNVADGNGAAVFVFDPVIAGITRLSNTVIFGSSTSDCDGGIPFTLQQDTSNWFGDSSCSGTSNGDPLLATLLDNGGLTKTHEPLPNSGLAGKGDVGICQQVTIDQRGEPRATRCYIGSFEGPPVEESIYVIPVSGGKAVILGL